MTRPALVINSKPAKAMPKYRPKFREPTKPDKPPRVFDHMNSEPEDARFCKVAAAMKASEWWLSWVGRPENHDQPKAVKGTYKPRLLPKHVEAMSEGDFDKLAQQVHDRSSKKPTRFEQATAWCQAIEEHSATP